MHRKNIIVILGADSYVNNWKEQVLRMRDTHRAKVITIIMHLLHINIIVGIMRLRCN